MHSSRRTRDPRAQQRLAITRRQVLAGSLAGSLGLGWGTMTKRPNTLVDATTFVDATIAYEFGNDGRYSVTAWGENLTSEKTCYVLGDLDGFTWQCLSAE